MSQREVCALGARQSIASFGPQPERLIPSVAKGLAEGLFGSAFLATSESQQKIWVKMCEEEYRALLPPSGGRRP